MKRTFSKKFVALALAAVAALLVAAFAVACNDKPTETQPTPVKLLLDYSDVKVDYEYDEPFTYAGLKVQVEMSDGTKQDVPSGYKVTPPDMTPGQRMVTVTYGSLSAKYAVYVEDLIKTIDDIEMFTVSGDGVYTIEAENIDLGRCIAEPLDETVGFIGKTGSIFISERSYLRNFGAAGNCVGASFLSQNEYEGVMLAVNVGNLTENNIVLSDVVTMYFGFNGADDTGELDITGMTLEANSWKTLVFDDLSLSSYGNVILEFIDDADIVWDSARVIVGSNGINVNSAVDLSAASEPVKLEIEDMNTEKLVTTDSVAQENGLKFGQPNLKDGVTGTSGKYVSDLKTGAAVSSWIYADGDMKANIKFNANVPADYNFGANWKFTVDGYVFNGASATATGWTEVDCGTVGLRAGRHLFTAELIGQTCDIDNFVFTPSALASDDDVIIAEDMPDKEAVIYNPGTYRVEAENLFDRSGWKHAWGEGNPIEYDPGKSMIDKWEWSKDHSSGMGVTRIKFGSVFKINFTLAKRSQIVFKIRIRKYKSGATIPANDAVVKIGEQTLTWHSNDDFTHTSEFAEDMPWGVLHCTPIALDAGNYVIELTSGDVCYDWFEIKAYDPSTVFPDAEIDDYGSYRVEAENLLDKSGWKHAWGEGNPIEYDPGKSMIDKWEWSKDHSSGMGVTRIKFGSVFKINFTLAKRSQIVFKIRIRKYKSGATIPANDAVVKIGEQTLTWHSNDDFTHPNDELGDMPWGVLHCTPIALDAGSHLIELTSGDVCYDWFEITAYDPSETIPDIEINNFGSHKVEAENLRDRSGWTHGLDNSVGGEGMTDRWSRDDLSGYCVTKIKNGSTFVLSFTLNEKSDVKISVSIGKWGYKQTTYDSNWMRDAKIGETTLTFAGREDSNFQDPTNGSLAYYGICESNTVTLEAGSHKFTWTSDDVNYDYFILDVSAPAA